MRGRGLVAAPVGAAVLYTAGALLTAGRADRFGLLAATIVVVSAAGWLLLDRPGPPVRVAAGRLTPVVALAAAAGALATLAVVVSPFEPRRLVDPPHRTVAEPSPLPRLAGWHEEGDVELLRVAAPAGTRLRLVTLGSYTGGAWSATASYRPLGTMADPTLPPGRHRTTVDATVTITTLDGLWLPTPGQPQRASLSDVDVEPESGSLALRSQRLQPGVHYDVRAWLDTPDPGEVAAAGVPSGPAARPYLDTPRLPWAFAEYARQITFGASTPFEQAVAIEYAVRDGRRHDPTAPVGSSYARLETFLFRELGADAGARVGTSEQFAAAFAVLARSIGLPSRVVLGFTTGGPQVGGMTSVRGRDAVAWPEVYFTGLGWYPFDPTPSAGVRADEEVKLLALDRMGAQVARAKVPVVSPSVPPRASPTAAPVASGPPGPDRTAAAGTVGAAAVVLVLLVLVGARRARTARHRRLADRGHGRRCWTCWCCSGAGRRPDNRPPRSPPPSPPTRRPGGTGHIRRRSSRRPRTGRPSPRWCRPRTVGPGSRCARYGGRCGPWCRCAGACSGRSTPARCCAAAHRRAEAGRAGLPVLFPGSSPLSRVSVGCSLDRARCRAPQPLASAAHAGAPQRRQAARLPVEGQHLEAVARRGRVEPVDHHAGLPRVDLQQGPGLRAVDLDHHEDRPPRGRVGPPQLDGVAPVVERGQLGCQPRVGPDQRPVLGSPRAGHRWAEHRWAGRRWAGRR